MFRPQCGRPALPERVFCAGCGARRERGETAPDARFAVAAAPPWTAPAAPAEPWTGEDWRESANYRTVLAHP